MDRFIKLFHKIIETLIFLIIISTLVSWIAYIGYLLMTITPILETLLWMFLLGFVFLMFIAIVVFMAFVIIARFREK
jgi:hypothetical protein